MHAGAGQAEEPEDDEGVRDWWGRGDEPIHALWFPVQGGELLGVEPLYLCFYAGMGVNNFCLQRKVLPVLRHKWQHANIY